MSFKRMFLIDFENVGSDGLNGIEMLTKDDKVVIFYSEQSNRLTMGMHISICKSPAEYEYHNVITGGKNALDNQLSSYLGYLIGRNESESYYIVSNDDGYKFITAFWSTHSSETMVSCTGKIKNYINKTDTFNVDSADVIARDVSESQPKLAYANLNKYIITNNMQGLYKYIVSIIGQAEGTVIYNGIKQSMKKIGS